MSNAAIISIMVAVNMVAAFLYLAVRHVASMLDQARSDAAEAWKAALDDRAALARAEAKTMQLTFELARYKPELPLKAPPEEAATASISPDTLRAIGRANGMDLAIGTAAEFNADADPTSP
jgi:hypothetical protein